MPDINTKARILQRVYVYEDENPYVDRKTLWVRVVEEYEKALIKLNNKEEARKAILEAIGTGDGYE